jgi:hypothetical protein
MRAVLGFLIGALSLGAITLGLGIVYLSYGQVSQREEAAAMGLVVFVTPAAALIGGAAGAILAALRGKPRSDYPFAAAALSWT